MSIVQHAHVLILSLTLMISNMPAAVVVTGNADVPDQTTSFPLGHLISTDEGGVTIVAAAPMQPGPNTPKDFAISSLREEEARLIPMAPEKITINRQEDQPNPLYDQAIRAITLTYAPHSIMSDARQEPLIVIENNPTVLYHLVNPSSMNVFLEHTAPINDAIDTPQITTGIIAIAAAQNHFLAAVKPHTADPFGATGSGIALIIGLPGYGFYQIDALTAQIKRPEGNRSAAFDVSSSFIKIGSNAASIGQAVDIYFDKNFNAFFIGYNAQAGPNAGDGVRGVVLAYISDHTLVLQPIAPDGAFAAGQDNIIGIQQANAQVSIHHVRTMHTSTGLNYLISHGGVGAPDETRNRVFALPLAQVNTIQQGTIADKNATVTNIFESNGLYGGLRSVTPAATTQAQMPQPNDPPVVVGGGPLTEGRISTIVVKNDTVFALVDVPAPGTGTDPNHLPGIFYSRALFDAVGKITSWTPWQRAVGTVDPIIGFNHASNGTTSYMVGTQAVGSTLIKKTRWSDGDANGMSPANIQLNNEFADAIGILGSFDFPVHTPALAPISANIVTGLQKIALIQTGFLDGATFLPRHGTDFASAAKFDQGTITSPVNNNMVFMHGGALQDIGPITAAAVATNNLQGWFVVGGSNGLAVLSAENGDGWPAVSGPGNLFTNLSVGMSFKKISSLSSVKKLITHEQYLYILTDTLFVRVDTTQATFGIDQITPTILAAAPALNALAFSDALVVNKLALLATTNGLWRSGNNVDIKIIPSITDAYWTPVALPEGSGVATQLIAQTTHATGGQVYVLETNYGTHQAQIHRFAIKPMEGLDVVDDTTVQLFPDLFVQDNPSYFVNFGSIERLGTTDGARYWFGHSKNNFIPLGLGTFSGLTQIASGIRFIGNSLRSVGHLAITTGTQLHAITANSAWGNWVITGDFGIRVHE